MTINQLRYFCTAARFHSITQAAKALFVTQPTISIAIRDLEKEFSLTLFSYVKNRLELTKEGEEFFNKAAYILEYCDDMQAEFSDVTKYRPTVKVGIPPMLSTVYFPELMDAFHEQYPGIYLDLLEYGSIRACEMVQDEKLDVGLVNMNQHNIDRFSRFVMSDEKLIYCVVQGHPFAHYASVEIQQLDQEPIILFNQDSVQNQLLHQQFHALGISPKIVLQSSQILTTLKFVRQKKCGCFLFSSMLDQFPELIGIPVQPQISMKVGLVWKKGKYLSTSCQSFIDFCEKYSRSMVS